jgi:CBS domain-containing protein
MTRRDNHFDAMLRHLGAAYYESQHGRASAADVSRALDSVEEHTADQPAAPEAAKPRPAGAGQHPGRNGRQQHYGRWHQRVRDVMTTSVITVDRITPYKEIATLLTKNKISSVPVLILGRHVAGVVSEADLLAVQGSRDRAARLAAGGGLHLPRRHATHPGLTAAELMTSPASTIHPDATLHAAARLMNSHHVKRLPVVNPDGTLLGIVSGRDLLSVFLRPDEEIAQEARELLGEILLTDPEPVKVRAHNGVVTLTGQPRAADADERMPVAMKLIWDIDGVVDVVNKISARVG